MSRATGIRTSWPGALVGLGAISALFVFDVWDGPDAQVVGLYAVIPALAATVVRPAAVAGVGLFAFGMAVFYGALQDLNDTRSQEVRLTAILLVSVLSMMVAAVRQRREAELVELTSVTQVLRQTILRPVPAMVNTVPVAVEYVSATTAAQVGGDLYEIVDTPFGVRALIGDVRGSGIGAVRLASVVLASFREAAHREADLATVAQSMDATVSREADSDEDFVTATMIQLGHDRTVGVVRCGHPPPLLLSGPDAGTHLTGSTPAAPLGFGDRPEMSSHVLAPGQRLLLYTDGVSEARAGGSFFPLEVEGPAAFSGRSLSDGARLLCRAVGRYAGKVHDDVSLMALEVPEKLHTSPASARVSAAGAGGSQNAAETPHLS